MAKARVNKDYEIKKLREVCVKLYGVVCDMGMRGISPDSLDTVAECKRVMDKLGVDAR